ncbi:MAG: hypothetical protein V1774_10410 [Candidatus Eisenbacteria bacterium]
MSRSSFRSMLVFLAPLACLIPLLLCAACSPERERIAVPEPETGFEVGEVTDYEVSETAETTVADTVSNATFVFPSGAQGQLGVARILTSPIAAPDSAEGFRVEFTSDDRIQLLLPRGENTEPLLWVYAIPVTSTYDALPQAEAWLPVMPVDTLSNPAVFELYEAGEMPAGARMSAVAKTGATGVAKTRPAQSYFFMRRYIRRDAWEWQNMDNIRLVTRWTIRDVIAALPGPLQAFALQETENRLALRGWVALASPEVSAYSAFEYWARGAYRRLYPRFSFVATGPTRATEATIAHEVGHYMSHVFLGDNGFEALSQQLREVHQFGDAHPERPMLEEYAQFVDYFKNGYVSGSISPDQPFRALRTHHPSATPQNTDWPSMEGYPTCLLARLQTESNTITGQSGGSEEIPAVNWSFSQLLGLLFSAKPLTVNQLRPEIALALEQQGEEDRLAPILERTGWSYHGHGTIRDARGHPVQGAWVRSKCKVPSEGPDQVYYAPLAPAETNASGAFQLVRLFPGENWLEVVVEDVTYEFPIEVDANRSTMDDVDLGMFTVDATWLQKLKTMTWTRILCTGEFMLDNGAMEVRLFATGEYDREHQVVWSGNTLAWDFSDSSSYYESVSGQTMHCDAEVSPDGSTVLHLACHMYEWESFQGRPTHTRTSDMIVENLPLTYSDTADPGWYFAYFGLAGEEIPSHVVSISFVERYLDIHDITHTATEFRWTGTTQPGQIEISLRDHSQ